MATEYRTRAQGEELVYTLEDKILTFQSDTGRGFRVQVALDDPAVTVRPRTERSHVFWCGVVLVVAALWTNGAIFLKEGTDAVLTVWGAVWLVASCVGIALMVLKAKGLRGVLVRAGKNGVFIVRDESRQQEFHSFVTKVKEAATVASP
jgi:hypothetical protein